MDAVELYLPNRKTLQDLFVPSEVELPDGDSRCQVFDFGGPTTGPGVNPFEVRELVWVADRPLVVWGLTGTIVAAAAPGAVQAAGFRFGIYQTHGNARRAWFNKDQLSNNVLGSGALPFLIRSPQLVSIGDSITVVVRSLVTAAVGTQTRIQVCLFGVQPRQDLYPNLYGGTQ